MVNLRKGLKLAIWGFRGVLVLRYLSGVCKDFGCGFVVLDDWRRLPVEVRRFLSKRCLVGLSEIVNGPPRTPRARRPGWRVFGLFVGCPNYGPKPDTGKSCRAQLANPRFWCPETVSEQVCKVWPWLRWQTGHWCYEDWLCTSIHPWTGSGVAARCSDCGWVWAGLYRTGNRHHGHGQQAWVRQTVRTAPDRWHGRGVATRPVRPLTQTSHRGSKQRITLVASMAERFVLNSAPTFV